MQKSFLYFLSYLSALHLLFRLERSIDALLQKNFALSLSPALTARLSAATAPESSASDIRKSLIRHGVAVSDFFGKLCNFSLCFCICTSVFYTLYLCRKQTDNLCFYSNLLLNLFDSGLCEEAGNSEYKIDCEEQEPDNKG